MERLSLFFNQPQMTVGPRGSSELAFEEDDKVEGMVERREDDDSDMESPRIERAIVAPTSLEIFRKLRLPVW